MSRRIKRILLAAALALIPAGALAWLPGHGGEALLGLLMSQTTTSPAASAFVQPFVECPWIVSGLLTANSNQIAGVDTTHLAVGQSIIDYSGSSYLPFGTTISQIVTAGTSGTIKVSNNAPANTPSGYNVNLYISPAWPIAQWTWAAGSTTRQPQPASAVAGTLATVGTTTTTSQITALGNTAGLAACTTPGPCYIFGPNIALGATVSSVNGTTVTMSLNAAGAGTASVLFSPLQPLIEQYHAANQSYHSLTNPLPICASPASQSNPGWKADGSGTCRYWDLSYSYFGSSALGSAGPFQISAAAVWNTGEVFLVDPAVYVGQQNMLTIGPQYDAFCYQSASFTAGDNIINFSSACTGMAVGDYIQEDDNASTYFPHYTTTVTHVADGTKSDKGTTCSSNCILVSKDALLSLTAGTIAVYRSPTNITVQGVTQNIGGTPTRPNIQMDSGLIGNNSSGGILSLGGKGAPGHVIGLTVRNIDVDVPPCTANCSPAAPFWGDGPATEGGAVIYNPTPLGGTTTLAQMRIWGGVNTINDPVGGRPEYGATGIETTNDDSGFGQFSTGTLNLDQLIVYDNGGGSGGTGPEHDTYIGHSPGLTVNLTNSHYYAAEYGHLFKSRAGTNNVIGNYLQGGTPVDGFAMPANGTSQSFNDVDLPCGGVGKIQNNIMTKGNGSNFPIIAYGEELTYAACTTYVNANAGFLQPYASNTLDVDHNTIVMFAATPDGVHEDPYFMIWAPDYGNIYGNNYSCGPATIYAGDNILDFGATASCLIPGGVLPQVYTGWGITDSTTSGNFPAYTIAGGLNFNGTILPATSTGPWTGISNGGRTCPSGHYCLFASNNAASASATGGDTIALADGNDVLPPQVPTFPTSVTWKDNIHAGFCPASGTGAFANSVNWPWYGTQAAAYQPNLILAPTEFSQTYAISPKYTTPDGAGIVGVGSYTHQAIPGMTRALPTIGAVD